MMSKRVLPRFLPVLALLLMADTCQPPPPQFPSPTNTPGGIVTTGGRFDFFVGQGEDICRSVARLRLGFNGPRGPYAYSVRRTDGQIKVAEFVLPDGTTGSSIDTDAPVTLFVGMNSPNTTGNVWLRGHHDASGHDEDVAYAVAAPTSSTPCGGSQ